MARQLFRVGFGYDPGHAILDNVADAVHSRGDTGHARRHGLQYNIGHALMIGRQQENVGRAHEFSGIGHTAEKAHLVVELEARHLALQLVEAAEIFSGDSGPHCTVPANPRDRVDEAVEALLRRQPTHSKHQHRVIAQIKPSTPLGAPPSHPIRRKNLDRVGHIDNASFRAEAVCKLLLGLARIADRDRDAGQAHPRP